MLLLNLSMGTTGDRSSDEMLMHLGGCGLRDQECQLKAASIMGRDREAALDVDSPCFTTLTVSDTSIGFGF